MQIRVAKLLFKMVEILNFNYKSDKSVIFEYLFNYVVLNLFHLINTTMLVLKNLRLDRRLRFRSPKKKTEVKALKRYKRTKYNTKNGLWPGTAVQRVGIRSY